MGRRLCQNYYIIVIMNLLPSSIMIYYIILYLTYIMHLFINTIIYMCHNSSFVSPVMYFRHDFTMILFLHKFTYNHLYTCIQFSDLT